MENLLIHPCLQGFFIWLNRAKCSFDHVRGVSFDNFRRPKTEYKARRWHRQRENLVGNAHVGVYRIIGEFQKEQQFVENECGTHSPRTVLSKQKKRKRKSVFYYDERLQNIVNDRENRSDITDDLRAHNLSF